jgi:hypothetical protein
VVHANVLGALGAGLVATDAADRSVMKVLLGGVNLTTSERRASFDPFCSCT